MDNELPAEILAALPCGVMTGAGGIIAALQVGPADGVLILGAGGVGLSAVMAAKMAGAYPIIVVDVTPSVWSSPWNSARPHVSTPRPVDVLARVMRDQPGGVRYALDSSGASAMWEVAAASSSARR